MPPSTSGRSTTRGWPRGLCATAPTESSQTIRGSLRCSRRETRFAPSLDPGRPRGRRCARVRPGGGRSARDDSAWSHDRRSTGWGPDPRGGHHGRPAGVRCAARAPTGLDTDPCHPGRPWSDAGDRQGDRARTHRRAQQRDSSRRHRRSRNPCRLHRHAGEAVRPSGRRLQALPQEPAALAVEGASGAQARQAHRGPRRCNGRRP
jgi:hypothetical protein